MTKKNKITLFSLICFLLAGCSLQLTESFYGEYSSYEKHESKYKVKNKEGLELGEERIPRIKKEIYRIRLTDSTVLDLNWISKRPLVGNRYKSYIDSTLRIDHLSGLDPINDSLIGTYQYTDFTYQPVKMEVAENDSMDNRVVDHLRNSVDADIQSIRSKRKIQILENGRCTYANYVPGGPDSGGGRNLQFSGTILCKGDTITAIFYREVLYKIPIQPFEIKLIKKMDHDTLASVIDGEISTKYGYLRIK